MAGAGGNPGPRPVRRPRAWSRKPRTRAASGLRPGALRPPARSWLTAAGLGRKPHRLRSKARPGAGRKTPRWSAERRAGQRHWPVIPGDPGIGPTARRVTGAAFRTSASRRSASPRMARDGKAGKGDPGALKKNQTAGPRSVGFRTSQVKTRRGSSSRSAVVPATGPGRKGQ